MQANVGGEYAADWLNIPRSNGSSSFGYPGQREDHVSSHGDEALAGHTPASQAGKLVQFLHAFQHLYELRKSALTLRLRTRDERNKVKASARRLQDITRRLIRDIKLQHDVTADLQALQEVIEKMDAQYMDHDRFESDLIPAEWKLKEVEKNLYEDVRGEPFLDPEWSDSDGRSSPKVLPELSSYGITMTMTTNPPQTRGRLEDEVAALKALEQEMALHLERLESEYEEIAEDAKMRAEAGMPVTALSQDFLSRYGQRRRELLDRLALISEEIRAIEFQPFATDRPKSPTTNSLPLGQFSNRETDVLLRSYGDNGDETLQLRAEDYAAREDDLHPVLDRLKSPHANAGVVMFPMSVAALEVDSCTDSISSEEPPDSSVSIVSNWLSHYFTASWWSAVRFAFEHYLDNTFSYVDIKRYMTDVWSREVGLPMANKPYGSEWKSAYTYWLPGTGDSSPPPVNPPARSHIFHSRPPKRRHSSGDSRTLRLKTHVVHSNRPNTQ
ncbi:hypothetical protein PV08_03645 [Exophiala spinifera]|uniref:Uncharacterized protein n=1 Tax=Exophiala spinifera TaxID=91928 RepID=A0A0D2BL88_9EURO|nr:uncharacterized protein PV08_03645 [Exophiala spinifera]KIW19350.1 hypothetical protein PV08_03645 [Exophiala spinifera]